MQTRKNNPVLRNSADLFAGIEKSPQPKHVYTVSEISKEIKQLLESAFGDCFVEGEVSNFAVSGEHFYFTLKDDSATLPAVMFSRANKEVKFKLENGLKVICFGKISAYAPHGKYQIIVEKIEPKGIGGLQLALEQLKAKLEKEGLFSPAHKREIPYLPARIGIVTSLQGAAIKDILKVLDRRFSDVHIIINSVQVQGDSAKDEIACAIKDFNRYNEELPLNKRIEVLIVGRGGGSIEDLWAFNEEVVARAIYNSGIPIISAVGHERDVTIADLVADLRAPTPSVAAELVVPEKEELRGRLTDLAGALKREIEGILDFCANELKNTQKKLSLLNPAVLLEQYKVKTLDLARQIFIRTEHLLKLKQAGFNTLIEKLSSLSPLSILGRGYSITFKLPEASIIKEARLLKRGDTIKTRLDKGEITSQVTEVQ